MLTNSPGGIAYHGHEDTPRPRPRGGGSLVRCPDLDADAFDREEDGYQEELDRQNQGRSTIGFNSGAMGVNQQTIVNSHNINDLRRRLDRVDMPPPAQAVAQPVVIHAPPPQHTLPPPQPQEPMSPIAGATFTTVCGLLALTMVVCVAIGVEGLGGAFPESMGGDVSFSLNGASIKIFKRMPPSKPSSSTTAQEPLNDCDTFLSTVFKPTGCVSTTNFMADVFHELHLVKGIEPLTATTEPINHDVLFATCTKMYRKDFGEHKNVCCKDVRAVGYLIDCIRPGYGRKLNECAAYKPSCL